MKIIIAILVCAVLVICVEGECGNNNHSKCAEEIVKDILKDTSVVENVDIQLQIPKFEQIKNVGIEDLNEILLRLTNWFENRLNETNFIFKHINNSTKIFVKSFDFNVNFEKGDAKIDIDLTEEPKDKKHDITVTIKENVTENMEDITNYKHLDLPTLTTTERNRRVFNRTKLRKMDEIDRIIEKLSGKKSNGILQLEQLGPVFYDDSSEENSTDYPIIDYIDMYKDTTNEANVYTPTEISTVVDNIITGIYDGDRKATERTDPKTTTVFPGPQDTICHDNATCKEFTSSVFPWVATIFVTNNSRDTQFSYYCDGALVTDRVIVTDARCMLVSNKTWDADHVLVFLGKGNLQSFGDNEKVHKLKDIVIHPNFTTTEDGRLVNALALLVLAEPVEMKENIQTACLHPDNNMKEAAATAWGLNGALVPIFFMRERSEFCLDRDNDIFCLTYGNDVALCPSYGGVLATRQLDRWCLQGIFHGNPADRGICFSKDVYYTSLRNYLKWIDNTIGLYKNDIM